MAPSSRSSTDPGRRRTTGWRSALTLQRHSRWAIALVFSAAGALVAMTLTAVMSAQGASARGGASVAGQANSSNAMLIAHGKRTFRFATFGDKAFWGGVLGLHKTIEGAAHGGIGPGLSPKTALALGLKVDVDALPKSLQQAIVAGKVDLNDPAVTLALLKLNAVVGVKGFFNSNGNLSSVGIECALCHSTVDNSLVPGIGHRLDGWANRDLNVGAIIGFAPNLQPIATLLHTSVGTGQVRRRAAPRRQGIPAQREHLRGADSAGLRPGRRQPAHLYRLGLDPVLERIRRGPGDARSRRLLRLPAQQCPAVPHRRKERFRARRGQA